MILMTTTDVLEKHQFFRPIAGADAEVFSQQSGHDDRACGADRSGLLTVATSIDSVSR